MIEKDVYFTFITFGNSTKVTAIDSETGIEVCIISPSSLSKYEMQQAALRKLLYMKGQKSG